MYTARGYAFKQNVVFVCVSIKTHTKGVGDENECNMKFPSALYVYYNKSAHANLLVWNKLCYN